MKGRGHKSIGRMIYQDIAVFNPLVRMTEDHLQAVFKARWDDGDEWKKMDACDEFSYALWDRFEELQQ